MMMMSRWLYLTALILLCSHTTQSDDEVDVGEVSGPENDNQDDGSDAIPGSADPGSVSVADAHDIQDANKDAANLPPSARLRGRSVEQYEKIEKLVKELQKDQQEQHGINLSGGGEWDGLVEGDIVIGSEEELRSMISADSDRGKRQLTFQALRLWPDEKNIKFFFDNTNGTFTRAEKNLIRQSLTTIARKTCLRFVERSSEPTSGDYIAVIKDTGCYSYIGRQGGRQDLSIGDGCQSTGIIIHEFMHAAGVAHEQSRTDRNSYVIVNYNYIFSAFINNFFIFSGFLNLNPYDYNSVMHYRPNAFALFPMVRTIDVIGTYQDNTIGQRFYMSFYDHKDINDLYCPGKCGLKTCKNGGYRNPDNCKVCLCPDPFVKGSCGAFRKRLRRRSGGAVMTLDATSSGSIVTPSLTSGQQANYLLQAPENCTIDYRTVTVTGTQYQYAEFGCYSWIEIKTKSWDWGLAGEKFCPNFFFTNWRTSLNNVMMILAWANEDGSIHAVIDYSVSCPTP